MGLGFKITNQFRNIVGNSKLNIPLFIFKRMVRHLYIERISVFALMNPYRGFLYIFLKNPE